MVRLLYLVSLPQFKTDQKHYQKLLSRLNKIFRRKWNRYYSQRYWQHWIHLGTNSYLKKKPTLETHVFGWISSLAMQCGKPLFSNTCQNGEGTNKYSPKWNRARHATFFLNSPTNTKYCILRTIGRYFFSINTLASTYRPHRPIQGWS